MTFPADDAVCLKEEEEVGQYRFHEQHRAYLRQDRFLGHQRRKKACHWHHRAVYVLPKTNVLLNEEYMFPHHLPKLETYSYPDPNVLYPGPNVLYPVPNVSWKYPVPNVSWKYPVPNVLWKYPPRS